MVTYQLVQVWAGMPFTAALQAGVAVAAGQRLVLTVRDEGGAALVTFTSDPAGGITITDAANGLATLAGTAAQANALPAGQHPFDLVLTDAAGIALLGAPLAQGVVMRYWTAAFGD